MLDELASMPIDGGWDAALLRPIAEVNQLLLEQLSRAALAGLPRTPRLLTLLREQWRRLDQQALQRLATCPYLLLDAGFAQPERWQRQLSASVMDGPAHGSYFVGAEGVALVRRTLLLAWHLARSNRLGACVLLGMSSPCAELIADSRLQDLEALAERAPAWIVPRFEQQPRVWQQLLQAACSGQAAELRGAQLRGLQLMAAAGGPHGPPAPRSC